MLMSATGGPRVYMTPGYKPEISIHEKTFNLDPNTQDKRPWEENYQHMGPRGTAAATVTAAAAAEAAEEGLSLSSIIFVVPSIIFQQEY